MSERRVAPYGSWKSPITADLTSSEVQLLEVAVDSDRVYWRELHPEEQGRYAVMQRAADGRVAEVVRPPFNARTLVHEYGGGTFTVAGGTVYFSNFHDQRLYRKDPDAQPRPITSEENMRYADGVIDLRRGLMFCIREDHSRSGREAVNTVVALSLKGEGSTKVLVSGNDFYSSPRLDGKAEHLAWLTWNHPNMPWDGTELWCGELHSDGSLGRTERVAGGPEESILQPEWSPDGILHFISDRTNWWNIYRWRDRQIESLCEMAAEFAKPPWTFGRSSYAFESSLRIVCTYTEQGTWHLAELNTKTRQLNTVVSPYTEITYLRATPGRAVFVGGSPTRPDSIVQFDFASGRFEVLYQSTNLQVDSEYLSNPKSIEFPTSHGLTAYGFFYPPKNRDFEASEGERPPLIVISHGGPTGAASTFLDMEIQFWTSRGFAVLDVNYGGSTGFGREYRQRLYGQWGVVDLDDCVNAPLYLVKRAEVDADRLIIRGGSAGGYTTLCALTFRNVFKAGASYFGLSDLEAFDTVTHKFESRYNVKLIGPYPERRDLYFERSPVHFADRISCPMILFQGLEDKIVPPSQAELMVKALSAKKSPYAYLAFEGEQHGFRRKENIKRSLEAELYFYSKIFGFELPDRVEPVKIENLEAH
jgi:dipeptidyl aminopeptidase/acylaminoacyl peptidase